jgi:prolyl-tRNA synthetase
VRWTQTLIPTHKEDPAEAEIPSHKLMVRAGLIRKLQAGAYSYLPLGWRALHKAIDIVREEMDAAGAIEILMPVIQPVELWEESGRYKDYGPMLMHFEDRAGRRTALGPTHEEVVTDIVRNHVNSYRQLPLTLYQIQTKFRDELRPRFGVLRSREFLMKDAYSFDVDLDGLNKSYDAMYRAYCRIFDRCGLNYVVVEAESGPIGGDASHEFMVPSDSGEDVLVQCSKCSYAANTEKAEVGSAQRAVGSGQPAADGHKPEAPARVESAGGAGEEPKPCKKIDTPGKTTIEQVSELLKCKPHGMVKTLIYKADGKPIAALVRGDHELNELKLKRALGVAALEMADAETIQRVTGAPVGFAGPVGIQCDVIADRAVGEMKKCVTGANAADAHLVGVVPGRDFPMPPLADLRMAVQGDPCPRCGAAMNLKRGIEVGHVFKLGTKYSKALGAYFLDPKEERREVIMGCYGIGVNRILAALIETNHDADGIRWSTAITPYSVLVLPLAMQNPEVTAAAETIYRGLIEAGIDALIDDRDARAGFKFKDADLIGIPLRVAIGEKGMKEGVVEIKWRHEATVKKVPVADAVRAAIDELKAR